jgi:two-component system nitrate/nitrite response regulator NarL
VFPRRGSLVIAARHPVVLCGLISMLRAESELNVVASCRDGATCIEAILELSPQLALLDLPLPGLSELLSVIRLKHLCTRVVFLSTFSEYPGAKTAIEMGAYDTISKEAGPQLVTRSLRKIASGRRLLPRAGWDEAARNEHESGTRGALEYLPTVLTERERQIMHLVSQGRSNKEVGRQLKLSDGTIKVHLHHIYQKLAIHNRTALVTLAARDLTDRNCLDYVRSPSTAVVYRSSRIDRIAASGRPHGLQPNPDEEDEEHAA